MSKHGFGLSCSNARLLILDFFFNFHKQIQLYGNSTFSSALGWGEWKAQTLCSKSFLDILLFTSTANSSYSHKVHAFAVYSSWDILFCHHIVSWNLILLLMQYIHIQSITENAKCDPLHHHFLILLFFLSILLFTYIVGYIKSSTDILYGYWNGGPRFFPSLNLVCSQKSTQAWFIFS